jgi:serine protease Do
MIRRREILGVAALSAFLGALLGLFLFGSLGGEITPGQPATASPIAVPASMNTGTLDPGIPLTTTTFSNVADRVMPAIVVINSAKMVRTSGNLPFGSNDPFMRRFFGNPFGQEEREREMRGLGSGVIVSEDGYILTNNHVVNDADKLEVRLDKHTTMEARVIGTDPESDLAVLKVDGKNLPTVKIGSSNNLKIGEWVVAVGAPFGLERSVTIGIVSAKGRSNVGVASYEDFIQTDAAINHGNSGGALVNLNGELVGVNTAIATSTGGSNGVGFAIPIDMARHIMESLIDQGKVTRGWIGVNIQNVDEKLAKGLGLAQPYGVIVAGVEPNSPAKRGGLESGDVILKMNGEELDDVPDLRNRVAVTKPGTNIELSVVRNGSPRSLTIKLDEKPKDEALAQREREDDRDPSSQSDRDGGDDFLGIDIRTLTPDLADEVGSPEKRGVLVTGVEPGSRAADAGLRSEDVILEVNTKPVASVEQFKSALGDPKPGDSVVLRVARDEAYLFIVVDL